MAARGNVVLETRDLTMRFGGVTAVDHVDFELREGELRCLIGPNGAGKSTFFKCLTGQLQPTSGDVMIQDRPMAGEPPCRIAATGVGVKTQTPSLFNGLTRSEEHTSELQSLMRISYAVFCLKKKKSRVHHIARHYKLVKMSCHSKTQ